MGGLYSELTQNTSIKYQKDTKKDGKSEKHYPLFPVSRPISLLCNYTEDYPPKLSNIKF